MKFNHSLGNITHTHEKPLLTFFEGHRQKATFLMLVLWIAIFSRPWSV